ncbi:putative nucleotidyltransferase, Ribonuclease H [Lupinus albus]|uniref:Putative nucleotidyltransferase, Ribonuclease H n=1 Tax=Lupinus albus TaxID=3870 RepID=A0A6A4P5G5_LUPAL|nr:putative nucleotidyltransferase, Ribonuclease H [Lupinus albus]
MKGFTSSKSWKMEGTLGCRPVIVMIDCGASHNFISKKLVDSLQLQVEKTKTYVVEVGDGHHIKCQGKCSNLKLLVQQLEVSQDFYLFALKGVDVVLGLEWLSSLGEVKADFGRMRLTLKKEGTIMTIEGNPALTRAELPLGAFMQVLMEEGEGMLLHCNDAVQAETDIPRELDRILLQYQEVFQEMTELPPKRSQDHAIHLKEGAGIPNLRPYRCPYYQKAEVERLVGEMLEAGVIQYSISPYSSPIILVKKKDGGWRFCVDYRALNKVTIPNKFPIPLIEELLDELGTARIFSKLDLKSGYHQIRMRPEDVEKTAFRTHEGHYEFLVMPFGLTNAPSTFQSLMNEILRPYLRKFTLVFFDDILIYSPDLTSHSQHLGTILAILMENSLKANLKKCSFGQVKIEYLGHVISEGSVAVDETKIEDVKTWPQPSNVKGLRGFLGLTGYYRKFVKDYGRIARPLTNLLKKDAFAWSEEAQDAFEQLKAEMMKLPMLAVPDFTKKFVVETDASSKGLGAVLMQEGRPLAFWSKGLSLKAQQKSVYERELMALVQAIQKWRHYLLGRHFIIRTDQRSLKFLTDQKLFSEEQFKWAVKLVGLDFEIQYKPGQENSAADALSRKLMYTAISIVNNEETENWIQEVQGDPKWRQVMQDLIVSSAVHPGFELKKGILYYKDRLVLSTSSNKIPMILSECHETPMGGHSSYFKTYKKISSFLFWEGMRSDIKTYIEQCDVCQRNKYSTLAPAGLLQPLPIPQQVWMDISMDFIGGLPRTKGKDTIFVVVDRLSKFVHFFALGHPFSAKDVALVFIKGVVRLHGFPTSIVSDRDSLFLSNFWKELFKLAGTQLKLSTSYHPQTDGQTEVTNRCLETYLRCYAGPKPKQWVQWLHWAEFWFNTNYHSAAGMTPFEPYMVGILLY